MCSISIVHTQSWIERWQKYHINKDQKLRLYKGNILNAM